jgi:hypothetical protein
MKIELVKKDNRYFIRKRGFFNSYYDPTDGSWCLMQPNRECVMTQCVAYMAYNELINRLAKIDDKEIIIKSDSIP